MVSTLDNGQSGDFNQVWVAPQQSLFTVDVRACNDAYQLLTRTPGNQTIQALEICIGVSGNTRSVLRLGQEVSKN